MFLLNIKIITKNLISLKKILNFLLKLSIKKKTTILLLNLTLLKTLNLNYNKYKKIITLLTSPQANKNAQEQFLIKKYSKILFLFSFNMLKIIILLKKTKIHLFSEIKIQLRFLYSKKKIKNIIKKIFNPENNKIIKIL